MTNDHGYTDDRVFVYDSKQMQPESQFKHQVAAVFGFRQDQFTIEWRTVELQKDSFSCGVYVIMYMLAVCLNMDPSTLSPRRQVSQNFATSTNSFIEPPPLLY